METLIRALHKTTLLLRKSEPSDWSSLTVDEVIRQIQEELQKAQTSNVIDKTDRQSCLLPQEVFKKFQ